MCELRHRWLPTGAGRVLSPEFVTRNQTTFFARFSHRLFIPPAVWVFLLLPSSSISTFRPHLRSPYCFVPVVVVVVVVVCAVDSPAGPTRQQSHCRNRRGSPLHRRHHNSPPLRLSPLTDRRQQTDNTPACPDRFHSRLSSGYNSRCVCSRLVRLASERPVQRAKGFDLANYLAGVWTGSDFGFCWEGPHCPFPHLNRQTSSYITATIYPSP